MEEIRKSFCALLTYEIEGIAIILKFKPWVSCIVYLRMYKSCKPCWWWEICYHSRYHILLINVINFSSATPIKSNTTHRNIILEVINFECICADFTYLVNMAKILYSRSIRHGVIEQFGVNQYHHFILFGCFNKFHI